LGFVGKHDAPLPPAVADNPSAEIRLALQALQTDSVHGRPYNDFVSAMVYGGKVGFAAAQTAVTELAETMIRQQGYKTC
jgi:hypothetical protein